MAFAAARRTERSSSARRGSAMAPMATLSFDASQQRAYAIARYRLDRPGKTLALDNAPHELSELRLCDQLRKTMDFRSSMFEYLLFLVDRAVPGMWCKACGRQVESHLAVQENANHPGAPPDR
jgi:hypothetical protein